MPRKTLSVILVALSVPLYGCQAVTPQGALPVAEAKIKVVATFSILGDLVHNVGGAQIELRTLVGPEQDTHTFEPSPADGAALAEASLIFEDGLGFESWLDKLYESSGTRAQRATVTQGIAPGAIDLGDEAGETDPHVWQDVGNAIHMVNIIRDTLVTADPANAEKYRANATSYLRQLQDLDQWVVAQVSTLPAERRKLVTNHDALGYFARRYGFELIGNVLGSISTEAAEPSAADMARLVDEIERAGVPAIFTENVENSAVIQNVATEAGVVVGPPLYTDALGLPGSEGDTYLEMMRYNVATIVAALSP